MQTIDTNVPKTRWSKEVRGIWENKCAYCGAVATGKYEDRIEAHHMLDKHNHPDEACDLTNGIALCHKCHLLTHCSHKDLCDFIDSQMVIIIPYGQKRMVEKHAKAHGLSVNELVNKLIRADMGIDNDDL